MALQISAAFTCEKFSRPWMIDCLMASFCAAVSKSFLIFFRRLRLVLLAQILKRRIESIVVDFFAEIFVVVILHSLLKF